MDELVKLAERCEQATGLDKVAPVGLETDIRVALGKPMDDDDRPLTSSLDAAMTLVPEGWDTQLRTHATTDGTALGVLTDKAWLDEEPQGRLVQGDAATAALALCAAALRARANPSLDGS